MCNSRLSSSIVAREGLSAAAGLDLEELYRQLQPFLPHLEEMICTGGEPFLSRFYFKLWKKLIEVNPKCKITLNTNATHVPDKAKLLMEKGRFDFNISLETVVKETYEKIRVNAVYEKMMENFIYLRDYTRRHQTSLSVPVCPLVLNYREISGLVEFCNVQGAYMVYVHVFNACDVALNAASTEVLRDALAFYKTISLPQTSNVERHNAERFEAFVKDVAQWKERAEKREAYIENMQADEAAFANAYTDLAGKVESYMKEAESSFSEAAVMDKLHAVFSGAPEYLRNEKVMQKLLNYPAAILVERLNTVSVAEIRDHLKEEFDRMVLEDDGA